MKLRAILMGGALAAAMTAAASAGFTQPAPVDVDLDNGFAGGDQISARADDGEGVFIGCGSRTIQDGAGGVFKFGFCQAEDADGDRVTCFTQDAGLLDAMRSTSDFAYITFSFQDDGNDGFECTRVGHSTQSFYLIDFTQLKSKDK